MKVLLKVAKSDFVNVLNGDIKWLYDTIFEKYRFEDFSKPF